MKTKKPKQQKEKRGRGRPTKYDPRFCESLIAFFSIEPSTTQEDIVPTKNGGETIVVKRVANRLPTFHRFAELIGVDTDTIVEWAHAKDEKGALKHPDFSVAYKKAKELQKFFLIENGMTGLYNPTFTIFVAKNITDMRDHFDIEKTVKERRVILDDED